MGGKKNVRTDGDDKLCQKCILGKKLNYGDDNNNTNNKKKRELKKKKEEPRAASSWHKVKDGRRRRLWE